MIFMHIKVWSILFRLLEWCLKEFQKQQLGALFLFFLLLKYELVSFRHCSSMYCNDPNLKVGETGLAFKEVSYSVLRIV